MIITSILREQGTADETANLEHLLSHLACVELLSEMVHPANPQFAGFMAKVDVMAVLLGSTAADIRVLEAATAVALKHGTRVVGVWLPGTEGDAVPDVLQKFGGGLVPWDLERLERAICKEEVVWTGPGGKRTSVKPVKRNKC